MNSDFINIPKISYNGIKPDNWIERRNSYFLYKNSSASTYINWELLVLRNKSKKEVDDEQHQIKKPIKFVKIFPLENLK